MLCYSCFRANCYPQGSHKFKVEPAADPRCFCLSAVQFALQLEYLEAAFYSCATTGAPLPANVTGSITVITEGCARGNYTEETYDVFGEIAADELNHVKVCRLGVSSHVQMN